MKQESEYLRIIKERQKNSKRFKPLDGSSYKNLEEAEQAFKNPANKKQYIDININVSL